MDTKLEPCNVYNLPIDFLQRNYLCKVFGHWSAGHFLSTPSGKTFSGYTGQTPLEWISECYEIVQG